MTSRELRQSFLDFFAGHDHRVLPSAPLKPTDETTLFTSAGMQPFVPWFRGIVPPAHPRVVTCQKCFRADDINEVGRTPYHCTFFEMLGNFSFGDYFKRGAIEYAWEFVTQVLNLPTERIWITVHPDDEEAPDLWHKMIGIPRDRIIKDPTNWWPPGGILGPCGPDTELHWDQGEEAGCGRPDCDPTCGCRRFTEIWNLVFQTYNKTESGVLEPLPKPGIDTGMGFERVTSVIQGVPSIFETDLLAPILSAVVARAAGAGVRDPLTDEQQLAVRVITDHVRALTFLLADGFTPSNEGAGYVVRRVLRIASRFGRRLGLDRPFLCTFVPAVVEVMGPIYPEVVSAQSRITTWVEQEEKQFEETIARSYGPLSEAIEKAKRAGLSVLPGEDVFRLHDTFGLPRELAADIAAESGLTLDEDGFEKAMAEQRARARAHAEQDFAFQSRAGYQHYVAKTEFLGHEEQTAEGEVIGLVRDGEVVDQLGPGEEGEVFTDRSPFYAEAGGQVGDRGWMENGAKLEVLSTDRPVEGAHAHHVRVLEGTVRHGLRLAMRVDSSRRQAVARAHTATHLLHYVLRQVLGQHALQSGSLVEADRLRFDFAHFSAVTPEERKRIEEGVVALALRDLPLDTEVTDLDSARAMGATALFGEKYGERVRVVRIGDVSMELCGGTHLGRSAAMGDFIIVSEGSIGTGLRRIEALTGQEAHAFAMRQREALAAAAESLHCPVQEVPERLAALQEELRQAQREFSRQQQKTAGALAADLFDRAEDVSGVKVIAARVAVAGEAMRGLADDLVRRLGSGIVVLGAEADGRVQFVSEVSKDLVAAGYHAGNLVREVAKIAGGGGGGRPDFAQAGGRSPEHLDEALSRVKELVASQRR